MPGAPLVHQQPAFTCNRLMRRHRIHISCHYVIDVIGSHSSDLKVGQICGNWYMIHLGRWSRAWKRYRGGWGRPPRLRLPCPMPPSAVAAGPVKKNGSDSDFWPFSGRPPPIGGLGRASADGAVFPNPPGPLSRPQTDRTSAQRGGLGGLVRPVHPR